MGVKVPPGFGLAAFRLSAPFGTPEFVTTIGVDLSAAGGDFVEAANQLHLAYKLNMMPQTLDTYMLNGVTLTVGQDGGGSGSVESELQSSYGARNSPSEAAAMAVIARKNTAQMGRKGRGRMFIPGWIERDQTLPSGEMDPGTFPALQQALDGFYTVIQGDSPTYPLLSGAVLLHADGTAPTPITSLSLVTKVGWIRKRIR